MSGLGRTAASGAAPQGHFPHIIFNNIHGPDSKYLSFACPKERYQRKRHPETCWYFQSQFPHIKKIGIRELARCSALHRAQTNVCYDPI